MKLVLYTSSSSFSKEDILEIFDDNYRSKIWNCGYPAGIMPMPEEGHHPESTPELLNDLISEYHYLELHIFTWSELMLLQARLLHVKGEVEIKKIVIFEKDEEDERGYTIKEATVDEEGDVSYWPKKLFRRAIEIIFNITKTKNKKL